MSKARTTPAATPTILDFRLTFFWVETTLELFSGSTQLADSFTFLRKSNCYGQVFEEVLAGKNKSSLEAPCKSTRSSFSGSTTSPVQRLTW
jgi:hypothetical protein